MIAERPPVPALFLLLVGLFLSFLRPVQAQDVDVSWRIPEDRYMEYERQESGERVKHLDLFGHEIANNGPAPNLSYIAEQVPFHLSLYLPGDTFSTGDSFSYEVTFSGLYPLFPGEVAVNGEIKDVYTGENGMQRVSIQQTFTGNTSGEMVQDRTNRFRDDYRGEPYCKSLQLETTQTLNLEEGVIEEFAVEGDIRFQYTGHERAARSDLEPVSFQVDGSFSLREGTTASDSLRKEVEAAIGRGLEFLVSRQGPDGLWHASGETYNRSAHALFALSAAGGSEYREQAEAGLNSIRERERPAIYPVTLLARALRKQAIPDDRKQRFQEALWNEDRELPDTKEHSLPPEARQWQREIIEWISKGGHGGAWGQTHGRHLHFQITDTISTWAALRALSAGALTELEPRTGNIEDGGVHLTQRQQREGPSVQIQLISLSGIDDLQFSARARGWSYRGPPPGSEHLIGLPGSYDRPRVPETAAGIAGMQTVLFHLRRARELRERRRNSLRTSRNDGVGWLHEHFSLRPYAHSGWNRFHFLRLYAVMDAMMAMGVKETGGRNWYREGARLLLTRQRDNGSWKNDPIRTSLALLFLIRSTRPLP